LNVGQQAVVVALVVEVLVVAVQAVERVVVAAHTHSVCLKPLTWEQPRQLLLEQEALAAQHKQSIIRMVIMAQLAETLHLEVT
jgi:hypothetical protein